MEGHPLFSGSRKNMQRASTHISYHQSVEQNNTQSNTRRNTVPTHFLNLRDASRSIFVLPEACETFLAH